MRKFLIGLCALAVSATTASAQLFDGDFATSNWSHSILFQRPVATLGPMSRISSGGNPGAYQRGQHTTDGGFATIYDGHLYLPFSYTPSTQGEISSIDVSMDWIDFDPGGIQFGLMVTQSGNTYIHFVDSAGPYSSWHTEVKTGITPSTIGWNRIDSTGVYSGAPDFSASGGTMQFGYYAFNWSTSSGFFIERTWGIDNFSVTINDECDDATPPVAEITDPSAFTCVCNNQSIVGSASDADGFDSYVLEYRPSTGGAWTTFASSTSPVTNGTLGTLNTAGLPQGYYFIRLTASNDCNQSSTDVSIVWVDQQFDTFQYTTPTDGAILGGRICPGGIIDDHCAEQFIVQYAAPGDPFQDIDPGTPSYTGPRINQTFAVWDTIANAIPDGDYRLRVQATDDCGHSAAASRTITVDNTPPSVAITSPSDCTWVDGIVEVTGTAYDANLASWSLQYAGAGSGTWVTIATGTTPIDAGTIAFWDTTGLDPCPYALRLVASDQAAIDCNGAIRHISETVISVDVGCPGDFNRDGILNTADVLSFLNTYNLGCP